MALAQIYNTLKSKEAYNSPLLYNHPLLNGGVPISYKPYRSVQDYQGTEIEDNYGGMKNVDLPIEVAPPEVYQPTVYQPPLPYVAPRQAPTHDNTASQELMRQAQAILAGMGNEPKPQIKAPNNESILLALLPALFGAGTNYIGQMAQGYMGGQNQELARIEQERQRREADALRQAAMLQTQAQNMSNREDLIYTQGSNNYRTEISDERMRELANLGSDTKLTIAGGAQGIQRDRLDFDQEKFEAGFVAKMWALALKDANMDGSVTEGDIARLKQEATRIGGAKYAERLPMPGIGDSWAKIKTDADMAYKQLVLDERNRHNGVMEGQGQARIDKPTGTRGGGSGGGANQPPALGGKLPTVSRTVAASRATTADANIKKFKKEQSLLNPQFDFEKRADLERKIQSQVVIREYYKRILNGEVPMFDPGAPTTDAAKEAAAKALAAAKEAAAKALAAANQTPAPTGAGIRIENSYAQGGDKSQKTAAEVDAEKKKAAAKKKADEKKAADKKKADEAKKKDKKTVTPQIRVNALGEKIRIIG